MLDTFEVAEDLLVVAVVLTSGKRECSKNWNRKDFLPNDRVFTSNNDTSIKSRGMQKLAQPTDSRIGS
jgi:hypothetical protein